MKSEELSIQRQIDIVAGVIYFFCYSELIPLLLNIKTINDDPLAGIFAIFGIGMLFYLLLGIYLRLISTELDYIGLVRLFLPTYLVILITDFFDYLLLDTIIFGTNHANLGVSTFALFAFLPVLAMLRTLFPLIAFLIPWIIFKFIPNLKSERRYVNYTPTIKERIELKERN